MKKNFNTYENFYFYLVDKCNMNVNYIGDFEIDRIIFFIFDENEFDFRKKQLLKYIKYVPFTVSPYPYQFNHKKYYDDVLDIKKIRIEKLKSLDNN